MSEPHQPQHIEGRVAVLERGMQDLSTSVNAGFNNQREENNRIYNALNALGDKFSAALQQLQSSIAAKGQISGSFILMLIATGLSLVAIIGGVVHFYVSDQIRNVKEEANRLLMAQIQLKSDNHEVHLDMANKLAEVNKILTEERIRAIKADAEHDVKLNAKTQP